MARRETIRSEKKCLPPFNVICALKPLIIMRAAIDPNVRRYVLLAQSRGGTCFCTRGAIQGYDVDLFILALAKTVTPAGAPDGAGAACAAVHQTVQFG